MQTLHIDFNNKLGAMKPMHAVNNGPVYKFGADQRLSNLEHFMNAGIPYARTHDASFYSIYGGEHTVDVHAIFPDFSKDPYDPASYDFPMTDEYLQVMNYAGVECYYRLGSKIEHGVKKYGTLPPPDFKKWAVICEHIIRHYTEGWADGFHYKITYWEIWNEPDLDPDDAANKRCWGGTREQFFELYHIAATHLKECFPHLKIGGPALAGHMDWAEAFLSQLKAPLDFFSWHMYTNKVEDIAAREQAVRSLLDSHGFTSTESILNEWNYVTGWTESEWLYSLRMEKSLKGAAFIAGTMCLSQKAPLDLLMYYDARPCGMNGMFNTDFVCDRLKGYYPFYMFNTLYKLGTQAASTDDENLYTLAATDGTHSALMLTHYDDNDDAAPRDVCLHIQGLPAVKATWYILNADNDLTLYREELYSADDTTAYVKVPNFTSLLVQLETI